MRVVIITQNDPFYLKNNIEWLLKNFPENCEIVGVVLLRASPFGKRLGLFAKALETWRIFGTRFLLVYALRMIKSKFISGDVEGLLLAEDVPIVRLNSNINSADSLKVISGFQPDLLISIAGNQIFKRDLISLAPQGCLNLHSSLLPLYRGLMPSFWVLRNEETRSGVSVFYVDEGIDSGPIIVQKEFDILGLSQQQLIEKSKRIGMAAIVEAVEAIRDSTVEIIENDAQNMTYFGFPTRDDVKHFRKVGARFF